MPVAPTPPLPPALSRALAQATVRVRLLRARRLGADGLLIGAALTGAALVALRLRAFDGDAFPNELLLLPPLAGLLGGALWGATRRVAPLAALRHVEQRLDLKERLSTAHVLSAAPGAEGLAALQIADAEAAASPARLNVAAALPLWPLPRRVWAAGVASLAAYLLWFLPTLPLFQSPAERAERAAVRKEGERIVRIAKALDKDAAGKKLDEAKRAAAKLNQLGEEMKRGRLSPQKAMMKAAKLTEELKRAQQAMASQDAAGQKSLPAAAREMQRALAAAQQAGKTGAGEKSPAENGLNPPQNGGPQGGDKQQNQSPAQQAMRDAQKALAGSDIASLAEKLSRLADQTAKGEPGDQAGREKLSEQLSALGKALEGTSLSAASEPLKEAADALKKGDTATASAKLREAARKAAESAKKSGESQALQKMADALSGQDASGDAQEGDGPADAGEGEGAKDAFGKDGMLKKGHVHTAECLKPGGT